MATADIAIRVQLTSKRKRDALKAVRAAAGSPFQIYAMWGLVDDPRKSASSFVDRLGKTEALWKLAREKWVSPRMLGICIQILSEGYKQHLLITAPKGRPIQNPRLPVKVEDLRTCINDLRSAARWLRDPLHPELRYMTSPKLADEVESRAETWGPLLRQLESWTPPRHSNNRPIKAKSLIEDDLGRAFAGDLCSKDARQRAAQIAADFLNDPNFATQDRAARRKRERDRGRTTVKGQ
ncbi:MAG: hypothetical protein IH884_07590 [Myxococcales bacterium]|nr:hypothetical protein [Myxococcales bacterium]